MPIQQGMNQQTPAVINTIRQGMSRVRAGSGKRKSKKKRAASGSSRKAKTKARKLKFGSPAWRKKYLKK
jgi:hypothetical protein